MYVVWGSKLYGKVDVVPGLFYVATRFGHVYYLPLIPLQSFVVTGQSGDSFRGIPIPLSFRSILLAWARAFLVVVTIVAIIAALVNMQDRDWTHWGYPAGIAVGALLLCVFLSWHRAATRARFERACALGQMVGLNEAGMAELCKIYGQSAGRGFAVTPTTAARTSFPSPMARPAPVVAATSPRPAAPARESLDPIPLEPMPEDEVDSPAPERGPELGLR